MKSNSTYKMSRPAKCILATVLDKNRRAALKEKLIESEVTYEYQKRISGKTREKSE